jgi:hypothetical protein
MTPLRVLVLGLSGLGTVGIVAIAFLVSGQLFSGEQLAREIAWITLLIYGAPYVLLVLPALVLGLLNRWLPLALGLCILTVPAVVVLFGNA